MSKTKILFDRNEQIQQNSIDNQSKTLP